MTAMLAVSLRITSTNTAALNKCFGVILKFVDKLNGKEYDI